MVLSTVTYMFCTTCNKGTTHIWNNIKYLWRCDCCSRTQQDVE